MIQTDRSRILSYQACPRRRFLEYHLHGSGIQRIAKALPLQFGSAFHEGAEDMLRGNIEGAVLRAKLYLSNVFEERRISFGDEAPTNVDEAWQYGAEEQAAMAEALLRGFWLYEGEAFLRDFEVLEVEREGRAVLLPQPHYNMGEGDMVLMFRPDSLVRERSTGDLYEISWKTFSTFGDKVINRAKVDMQSCSEVWGRENQEDSIYDKKSRNREGREQQAKDISDVRNNPKGAQDSMLDMASTHDEEWLRNSSTQALSERYLGTSNYISDGERLPQQGAVLGSFVPQSELCPTGSFGDSNAGRELSSRDALQVQPRDSGCNTSRSRESEVGVSETGEEVRGECTSSRGHSQEAPEKIGHIEGVIYRFAAKGYRRKDNWDGLYKQNSHLIYGWRKVRDADDSDWSWSFEFPNEEDPSKMSRLGKGWKKVPIWREYPGGVKAWVEGLAKGEIFPRHENPLEQVFPMALPVSRREDEIERWKRTTVAQELRVARDVEIVKEEPGKLDELFPMYTDSCFDYGQCSMFDACWTPAVSADPVASGLYQIRLVTNHPERLEEDD